MQHLIMLQLLFDRTEDSLRQVGTGHAKIT